MTTAEQQFHDAWRNAWQPLHLPAPDVHPLLLRYAEPHRHYHTADHINECLNEQANSPDAAAKSPTLTLAIFYHDALYNPRAADNEAQSALLAQQVLAPFLPPTTLADITRLIQITDHRTAPAHADERLLLDIDLAILGQPTAPFDAYESAIRKEYAHVPDADFRAGRTKILTHFLARPRLYHTPHFFTRYETGARENLRRSIHTLKSAPTAG